MRAFAAILLAGLSGALPALATGARAADVSPLDSPADPSDPGQAALAAADRIAIRKVIADQMGAFQRDDAAAAFGFASPGIQAMFGDAAHFLDMVRQGYQQVYRPKHVTFGALTQQHGQPVQHVELIGPDGAASEALYFMQHESDGNWRIDGCVIEPGGGASV